MAATPVGRPAARGSTVCPGRGTFGRMKLARASRPLGVLFAVLVIATAVYGGQAYVRLPDEVMVGLKSFGPRLAAKGWLLFGFMMVLVAVVGMFSSSVRDLRRSDGRDSGGHIAHADYWLAPQRRAVTVDHLAGAFYLMGCIACVGIVLVFGEVFEANMESPPRLPPNFPVLVYLGAVIAADVGVFRWARRPFLTLPPGEGGDVRGR